MEIAQFGVNFPFLVSKHLQIERQENRCKLFTVEAIFHLDRLDLGIFTMSPLAPEAPTGPYRVKKGEKEGKALRAM